MKRCSSEDINVFNEEETFPLALRERGQGVRASARPPCLITKEASKKIQSNGDIV